MSPRSNVQGPKLKNRMVKVESTMPRVVSDFGLWTVDFGLSDPMEAFEYVAGGEAQDHRATVWTGRG